MPAFIFTAPLSSTAGCLLSVGLFARNLQVPTRARRTSFWATRVLGGSAVLGLGGVAVVSRVTRASGGRRAAWLALASALCLLLVVVRYLVRAEPEGGS